MKNVKKGEKEKMEISVDCKNGHSEAKLFLLASDSKCRQQWTSKKNTGDSSDTSSVAFYLS